MAMYGLATYGVDKYGIQAAPGITVTANSKDTISDETGFTTCTVSFQATQDLIEWEARANGTGQGTGLLVGAGGSETKDTTIQFDVTYDELTSGDGVYRINVYGRNNSGEWTEYGT